MVAPEEELARKVAGALRLPLAQVRGMVMAVRFRWPLNKQYYLIAGADICGRSLKENKGAWIEPSGRHLTDTIGLEISYQHCEGGGTMTYDAAAAIAKSGEA